MQLHSFINTQKPLFPLNFPIYIGYAIHRVNFSERYKLFQHKKNYIVDFFFQSSEHSKQ